MAKAPGQALAGQAVQREVLGTIFPGFYEVHTVTTGSPQGADGRPWNGQSDVDAFFPVSANTPALAIDITLVVRNTITGVSRILVFGFSGGVNLQTAQFLKVNFNSQLPQLLPPICGSGDQIEFHAVVDFIGAPTEISPTMTYSLVRSPCFDTQLVSMVYTSHFAFDCIGIQGGQIGVQGRLLHCGNIFGVGVCQAFPGAPVSIGLTDPVTGIFYEYVVTHAAPAGTLDVGVFSIGFAVANRPEVVALVPPGGQKVMMITAMFHGDNANSPSPPVTQPVTIRGVNAGPCFQGTLISSKNSFPGQPPVPAGEPVHNLHLVTISGINEALLKFQVDNLIIPNAEKEVIRQGAHPVLIEVFRGPDVPSLTFFGAVLGTVITLNIHVQAWGSPVAPLVLLIALVALLVLLGIIILWISQTWDDILSKPGGPILAAGAAAAAVGFALVAGYFVLRSRKGKS